MNTFTNDNLKEIRQAINEALTSVSIKYNIELTLGKISYSEDNFYTKLEGKLPKTKEEKQNEKTNNRVS